MSEHRRLVDRLHQAFNTRRFEEFDEVLADDALWVLDGQRLRGIPAIRDFVAAVVREVPGVRWERDQVIADGADAIVMQTRFVDRSSVRSDRPTWQLPIPCDVYRIAAGRIVERRNFTDPAGDGAPATARRDVVRLTLEQAALRRVATLVARGVAQIEIFTAIVSEASALLSEEVWLARFEVDGTVMIIAQDGADAGQRLVSSGPLTPGAGGALDRVRRTGKPVRVDSYAGMTGPGHDEALALGVSASAAAPLVVQGAVWGALGVVGRGSPLESGIEDRLAQFADLAATAIANIHSQTQRQALADEQAALRRVAELVARGAATQEIFDRVTVEASRVVGGAPMSLGRYEKDGAEIVILAQDHDVNVGARIPVVGDIGPARAWRTGEVTRTDDYSTVAGAAGVIPKWARASVSAPVFVEARLWGLLSARSAGPPLPAGTEARLMRFCELVGAAIANAESRAQLTASRARVVAGADEARRRLARDVHDGAQQRLVHTLFVAQQARDALADPHSRIGELLEETLRQAQRAYDDLRRLAQGILPAALEQGGLEAAVDALLAEMALPAQCEVLSERLAEPIETTAYFVIAEALTNVVKHADAGHVRVRAVPAASGLSLEVSDDGRGGARPGQGSGLLGLADRVDAAGGTLSVASAPDAGTTITATLPFTHASPEKSG